MQLQPGTIFAGFTIERRLGVGGMGVVYLARHPRLNRLVALKVLSDTKVGDAAVRTLFDREVDLVARLEHPNIIPVYDRGSTEDGTLWLSMRYIVGGDIAALLTREHSVPSTRAVGLIAGAAAGLDHAHRNGVIHRDVKPANLLLDIDGVQERAVVADFGIARTLDATMTASGLMASLAYTAPERFRSEPADHRADIYSLGCTFFELLTGRQPFPGRDQAAVIAAHLLDPPPRPSQLHPGLPPGLDYVIATAMAKQPGDRYPSCTEFATEARRVLAAAYATTIAPHMMPTRLPDSDRRLITPEPATRPPSPTPRSVRWALAAAVLALTTAVAAAAFVFARGNGNPLTSATTSTQATTSSTTLPAQSVNPPQVIAQCDAAAEIRPDHITSMNCGTNASTYIDALTWTRWDATKAEGTGTEHLNSCKPTCSAGNYNLYPVTVTLDAVIPFSNHYSRITITGANPYSGDLPT
ncbi:serine/threonine-protein kinase [Nocardia sp. NPDC051030]|uniref:serine/threonine-protein kinase n=1 Tax=Nocardia sp. NPDC051030 TaxID=3155162 RepID=UPI003448B17B